MCVANSGRCMLHAKRGVMRLVRQFLVSASVVALVVLLWAAAVSWYATPEWLVPSPARVWRAFLGDQANVLRQVGATGLSAVGGLVIGSVLAVCLAIAMHLSRKVEAVLMPLLVIDQSIPKIALAPILIVWFGAGLASRIAIAIVVSFFPMIISTLRGLRGVDRRLPRLMHTLAATRLQLLLKIQLPAALPDIFAALRIAAPLAVTGAIVAEFVQAKSGIGYMIMLAMTDFNTPLVFVAVLAAALLCLCLYGVTATLPQLVAGRRFGVLTQAHSRQ